MKCFSPQFDRHSIRQYGIAGVMGLLLVIGGLALKPASRSIADTPQVLGDSDRPQSQAKALSRAAQRQEQSRQIRPENFSLARYPVTNQNEKHWRNLLWTTAVVQPQEAFAAEAIEQILSLGTRTGLSDAQKRTIDMAARVGTQLYLSNPARYAQIGEQFRQTIDRSADSEWVAMSLSGLANGGLSPEQIQTLVGRVKARFPNWAATVPLQTTLREMAELISPSALPPLRDLLNWEIAPKQAHLYVLCQRDRTVLCQTVLKDRNGEFVRQSNGQLWSVPLLLRSIHGLSSNFVRGETPQGVYRMEGEVSQPDDEFFRAYGQFPLVNLFVPFEPGAKQFVPGTPGPFKGSLDTYKRLLPPTWRNHGGIQESFWAGKAGRSLFRIHGTGESPDFFSGKDKNPDTYNWNPTIGCLSALELYNEQGQLLQADMPKILKALQIVGGKKFTGYMVVVDLPGNARKPVALETIETVLRNGKLSLGTQPVKPLSTPVLQVAKTQPANLKPATPIPQAALPPVEPIAIEPSDTTSAPAAELPSVVLPDQPEINPSTRPLPMAY